MIIKCDNKNLKFYFYDLLKELAFHLDIIIYNTFYIINLEI